jgi:hypothetical protein
MKVSIIHTDSETSKESAPFSTFRDNRYAIRFVKVLRANSGKNIAQVIKTPASLPYFIDDPADHLPHVFKAHDVLVCINIHEELLLHIPLLAKEAGCRAILVPREDHEWVTPWTMESISQQCTDLGMDIAFPKPFCALEKDDLHPVINVFIDAFKIGRPKVNVEIAGTVVKRFDVEVSAPCGDTYYVARNMKDRDVGDKLDWWTAKFWGSYPCIGSMKIDPETNDSVQHLAGHILIEEVYKSLENK